MISICIYCGENKAIAFEACNACSRAPDSHRDQIRSIILSYSENEPYLNFLSLEELEEVREKIITGAPIELKAEVYRNAEEAFSAVKVTEGPKLIQYFSGISVPVTALILLAFLAAIFI